MPERRWFSGTAGMQRHRRGRYRVGVQEMYGLLSKLGWVLGVLTVIVYAVAVRRQPRD